MSAKVISYARNHQHDHTYRYDEIARMWKFVSCRLNIPGADRCTGSREDLPRGTKFDGETTLNEYEELQ